MNLFILLSTLLLNPVSADTSSIYRLQFTDIDSNIIDMSSYTGKHIIVYEFDVAQPDKEQMIALDSLYKNSNNNIMVIAIPAKDLDSAEILNESLKILIRDSFQVSYPVTTISLAKKATLTQQHPLLDWATHVEKNNHFDDDVIEQGYMFVISDTGTLYSIIKEKIGITSSIMQEILTNEPLE